MTNFQKSLDRYLTSEPPDDTWWYEQVSEYTYDHISADEWDARERQLDDFLQRQLNKGLNPPQAAIELIRELFPSKFADYSKTYPLRAPGIGETWCWKTASVGDLHYTVLGYDDICARAIMRLTANSAEELLKKNHVNVQTYMIRRPTLVGLYRQFVLVKDID